MTDEERRKKRNRNEGAKIMGLTNENDVSIRLEFMRKNEDDERRKEQVMEKRRRNKPS